MENLKVGIQLYSVRDEMAKDMDATLAKVAGAGYTEVEFAGFFDKEAEEVKELLAKYNLHAPSVHQKIDPYLDKDERNKLIKYLQTLGIKNSIIPWFDKALLINPETYKKFIAEVREVGKILADNGIAQGYHNHDFEFETVNGEYILDRIYNDVPAEELLTELDVCWVKYGGEDPVKYINKYASRMNIIHFKDFFAKGNGATVYALIDENGNEIKAPTSKEDNEFKFMPLGQGLQDFASIIEAAKKSNAHTVVYEKDQWYDGDPIADAITSRNFLKKMGL